LELRSQVIEFEEEKELRTYIVKEFMPEKIKADSPNKHSLSEIKICLPGNYANCHNYELSEMPSLEDAEHFELDKVILYMQKSVGRLNPIFFINLDSKFEFHDFENLWEVLNESE
jgi:hypothetical protein